MFFGDCQFPSLFLFPSEDQVYLASGLFFLLGNPSLLCDRHLSVFLFFLGLAKSNI